MDNIKKIIQAMTLKEKVAQLNQNLYGWQLYKKENDQVTLVEDFKQYVINKGGVGSIYGLLRADPWSKVNYENGLTKQQSKEIITTISDYVASQSRFNIAPLVIEETPHGHQGLNAIMYPTNLAVGASFNPSLYQDCAKMIAQEMRELGVSIGLFAGLDIARDVRWGRTEETFGEDPYLASQMTAALMKGVNPSDTNELNGFTACLKHFAAQGQPYMGLNSGSVSIGERELREIHLSPMQTAIHHGAKMCMAAYNEIDGIPCHVNKRLLTTILRDEMGFDGVVLTDGCALNRLITANVNEHQAAHLSLDAGIDLSLWDDVFEQLEDAVNQGVVSTDKVDRSVERLLRLKQGLGLIRQPNVTSTQSANRSDINQTVETVTKVNPSCSKEMAKESIVLQQNHHQLLPLKTKQRLAVIGELAADLYSLLGDYTPTQKVENYNNILQAITKDSAHVDHFTCQQVCLKDPLVFSDYDAVIFVGGGTSKRNFDMTFDPNGAVSSKSKEMECGENADIGNINLNNDQQQVIKYLENIHSPIISIIIQGRGYALGKIAELSHSVLSAYYPGQYGGDAIADILFGRVNPSAKNPISLMKTADYFGYQYNSKQDNRKQTYINNQQGLLYPFGHGLSYSQFEYQNFSAKIEIADIAQQELKIRCCVTVKNISDIIGKEVVQLYLKKENTLITKRHRELIAFEKITLDAYEATQVFFEIDAQSLSTIGLDYQSILEPGHYQLIIGNGEETWLTQSLELKLK